MDTPYSTLDLSQIIRKKYLLYVNKTGDPALLRVLFFYLSNSRGGKVGII